MHKKLAGYGGIGIVLLAMTLVICLGIGSVAIPIRDIVMMILHHLPWIGDDVKPDWNPSYEQIIMKVRMPRLVLGMLVGTALAVAGSGFQGVLRNPLADPFTLGVSSGSAVGASALIFFGLQYSFIGSFTLPFVAFITGILTLWAVMALSLDRGKIPTNSLILSGVVMQSFLGAIVSFMTAMSNKTINEILYWTMGSLSLRGWSYTLILLPYLLIGLSLVWGQAKSLNVLSLGERQAAHLGMRVERVKFIILLVCTLLTAAAVSVAGIIGFVGLVIPHVIRLLTGPDYRLIVPLSAIGGAIFMVIADTLARTVLAPTEIPLGVVTAFVGAPFFAYLLHRSKKHGRGGSL
ncbi:FecCD family ABC transporter permease [Paenibacillus pini]|uniref:Vitamin B12 ABC transporter n=1 Tax=Paenibacillus pini JCM 16418 TaxID=1236976 RepID=W7YF36_9BACL|nr:iron chelate uptake ABC transporter family permease subunit [Paenibacillus pini]GAF06088.1 vitamin B12 ABC transporter [Paenibacillus pini JCM 16418]